MYPSPGFQKQPRIHGTHNTSSGTTAIHQHQGFTTLAFVTPTVLSCIVCAYVCAVLNRRYLMLTFISAHIRGYPRLNVYTADVSATKDVFTLVGRGAFISCQSSYQ